MFKKICAILAFVLTCVTVGFGNSTAVFSKYADSFEVYLSASSNGEILSISENEFGLLGGIKGESFRAEKREFDLAAFLKDFDGEILFREKLDCGTSYYGYSPKIKYRKKMNGKIVNFHVFIGEKNVTVGAPIIYGSF